MSHIKLITFDAASSEFQQGKAATEMGDWATAQIRRFHDDMGEKGLKGKTVVLVLKIAADIRR